MNGRRIWKGFLAPVLAVLAICMVSTTAFAAHSPKPAQPTLPAGGAVDMDPAHANNAAMDPTFVALKNAYRINSGVQLGQGKGGGTKPYVMAAPMNLAQTGLSPLVSTPTWGSCTICAELSPTNVQTIWEPGNGKTSNFGPGTATYDDHFVSYGGTNGDGNFFNLCGPGAADVTTWYWPLPPNLVNDSAYDPYGGATTSWNGQDVDNVSRSRGYMVRLAWKISPLNANGSRAWTYDGLMQHSNSTLDWRMAEGLNWEISGHNQSSWRNYFYVVAPSSQGSNYLHSDIVSDIAVSHVPVVVLLNARAGLPNWPSGGMTQHYITIIGYNDDAGQYAYVDTCGKSTGCNSYSLNLDGHVQVLNQSSLWNAVASYGDWIW